MNVLHALRATLLAALLSSAAAALEPPNFAPFEVTSGGHVLAVTEDPGQAKVDPHKKTWTATVYTVDAEKRRTQLWSTPFLHTGFSHNHVLSPNGRALISVRDIYKPDVVLASLYRPDQKRVDIKGAAFDAPPEASQGWHMWLDGNGSPKVRTLPEVALIKSPVLQLTLIDKSTRWISFVDGAVQEPKQ